jgi:hypothetical protein
MSCSEDRGIDPRETSRYALACCWSTRKKGLQLLSATIHQRIDNIPPERGSWAAAGATRPIRVVNTLNDPAILRSTSTDWRFTRIARSGVGSVDVGRLGF